MKASVTLFKSRQLINGEYSVKVRIFENGKYKHYDTGVSCKESNWNANKCRVSSKDIAYKEKNAKIEEVYKMYVDGEEQSPRRKDNEILFYDIIALKKEKAQAINTKKTYNSLELYLKKEYPTLPLSSLTQEWFDGFVAKLKRDKPIPIARRHISTFLSAYRYGFESGLIKTFKKFNWNAKDFSHETADRMLNTTELNVLLFAYRQTQQNYNYLAEYTKEDKALMLYILHIALQGIAPVDMAYLKVGDLKKETLNTLTFDALKAQTQVGYIEEYNQSNERIETLTATLFRHKTSGKIDIATDYESIKPILNCFMKGKTQDDYLIDCFANGKEYTEVRALERLHNYYVAQTKYLNRYITRICKLPVFKEQSIDVKRITYYTARHTFINKVASMNVDYNTIRRMIGHKTTVLEKSYITEVSKIEQVKVMRAILKDSVV